MRSFIERSEQITRNGNTFALFVSDESKKSETTHSGSQGLEGRSPIGVCVSLIAKLMTL